jgi:hypothetical protein
MPNWIALLRPLPRDGENVIILRRETHVVLDISLDQIPTPSPLVCSGVKLPSTASVKNFGDATGETLLLLHIHVYGATTKRRYETPCENCARRDGRRKGTPAMVDFHAEYNIIDRKDGKIRVDFNFCCYPKCHKLGDKEFL